MLGDHVCQLILAFGVVNDDLALLHKILHEKIPQRDMPCARTVGTVAGDMQCRRLLDIQRNAASIVDCAVNPCSSTLKLIGALASVTMKDNVDLPLSGLLPPLEPGKVESLKPPSL